MDYYVKVEELLEVQKSALSRIGEWFSQLEQVSNALQQLAGMSEVQGRTGDSIRSYIAQVHIPLVASLQQMLQEFQVRLTLYADGYYEIDGSHSAEIPEECLENQERLLNRGKEEFDTIKETILSVLDSVSDIVRISRPSGIPIEQAYHELGNKVRELNERVGEYEETHQSDVETVNSIIEFVNSIITARSGRAAVSVTGYKSGSVLSLPAYQRLGESLRASSDFVSENLEQYEEAISRYEDRLNDKVAEERKEDGFLQILGGVVSVIAGAALIIATAGMATPIVVGAAVVGSTSMLYGLSNSEEGISNISLGFQGDGTTLAVNPIRDTFFGSNPEVYYTIGNASTLISGLAIPMGGAYSGAIAAGTSSIRAMAVEGGKLVISGVAGEKGSEWIYEKTDDKILATLGGIGIGAVSYGGLHGIDKAANISGIQRRPEITNISEEANMVKEGLNKESYSSLSELMSPEEAERYLRVLEKGSSAGMSKAEIAALENVDKQLALKKVDYSTVLKLRNRETGEAGKHVDEILSKSTCSPKELDNYLNNIDSKLAEEFKEIGKWSKDIQVPKDSSVLTPDGNIDWSQVSNGGFVLDETGKAIKEAYTPKVGEIIDRYGPSNGRYTSPVKDGVPYSYDQRSLPYVEDASKYHKYEVVGDFNKISEYIDNASPELKKAVEGYMKKYKLTIDDLITQAGKIAPGFGAKGYGIQYELPMPVNLLEDLKILLEVK